MSEAVPLSLLVAVALLAFCLGVGTGWAINAIRAELRSR